MTAQERHGVGPAESRSSDPASSASSGLGTPLRCRRPRRPSTAARRHPRHPTPSRTRRRAPAGATATRRTPPRASHGECYFPGGASERTISCCRFAARTTDLRGATLRVARCIARRASAMSEHKKLARLVARAFYRHSSTRGWPAWATPSSTTRAPPRFSSTRYATRVGQEMIWLARCCCPRAGAQGAALPRGAAHRAQGTRQGEGQGARGEQGRAARRTAWRRPSS